RELELSALLQSAFDTATGSGPLASAVDDAGVEYTLACLSDPDPVARIHAFLGERPCVIADGHHRYETALEYRRQQRAAAGDVVVDAPFESTLAYFANAYAPGSLLLPIHRVIREVAAPDADAWLERLPGWRCESVAGADIESVAALLEQHLAPLTDRAAFAADDGSGVLRIFSRDEPLGDALMVRVIEEDVIGRVFGLSTEAIREGAVSFPKSAARAAREVREGQGTVALYLNALSPDDVFRVTGEGEVMPQKSTFFYPKVPTGMVFRVHEPSE
ncbi:MAG: DUF1015 family protein, partial [Deltaproteobacteria bacterium]|nr:DUF1015 family protein [Deltaproteobacteria bacterium]